MHAAHSPRRSTISLPHTRHVERHRKVVREIECPTAGQCPGRKKIHIPRHGRPKIIAVVHVVRGYAASLSAAGPLIPSAAAITSSLGSSHAWAVHSPTLVLYVLPPPGGAQSAPTLAPHRRYSQPLNSAMLLPRLSHPSFNLCGLVRERSCVIGHLPLSMVLPYSA